MYIFSETEIFSRLPLTSETIWIVGSVSVFLILPIIMMFVVHPWLKKYMKPSSSGAIHVSWSWIGWLTKKIAAWWTIRTQQQNDKAFSDSTLASELASSGPDAGVIPTQHNPFSLDGK